METEPLLIVIIQKNYKLKSCQADFMKKKGFLRKLAISKEVYSMDGRKYPMQANCYFVQENSVLANRKVWKWGGMTWMYLMGRIFAFVSFHQVSF